MSDARAIKLARLYADESGESRFEIVAVPMSEIDFAPPAAPLYGTQAQSAQDYFILELPVDGGGTEPHPAPGRHMLVCLAGKFRVTTSSGEAQSFAAGDSLADGGHFGQRAHYRGHIAPASQGHSDPASITVKSAAWDA